MTQKRNNGDQTNAQFRQSQARMLNLSPAMAAWVARQNRLAAHYAGRASTDTGIMPVKIERKR